MGMDDPYKSAEDALSDIIRDKTWRFYTDTAEPRLNEQSNCFIMFHRYHQDDQGGRAIATGDFELWRYAAEADGEYEDDTSGLKFPCLPLDRAEGEYLSPRFSNEYYERQKRNVQIWLSQFQGRPTSKSGLFFNVTMLQEIDLAHVPPILFRTRAWDNAATEGAGAFSAGVDMGMDAAENFYIFDVERKQVGTGERRKLQIDTAKKDGKLVHIHGPQDPGSAGKDAAFDFEQMFLQENYSVTTSPVSGSKEMRAYPYSQTVNTGKTFLVRGAWDQKEYVKELRSFPLGTYKDQVDASADAHNYLKKLFYRGLVMKGAGIEQLLPWSVFKERFGFKIPAECEVGAAVRFEGDSSKPSGWAIVARASEIMQLGEVVFVVAAGRKHVSQATELLSDLLHALRRFCAGGTEHPQTVWLGRNSPDITQVALEKFNFVVQPFTDDAKAGIAESNWYLQSDNKPSRFFPAPAKAQRCYLLVSDNEIETPETEDGLVSTRQEFSTWGYNDLGEPQRYSGITLDCIRMILYNFALTATAMTAEQRYLNALPDEYKPAEILKHQGQPEFVELYLGQQHMIKQIEIRDKAEQQKQQQQLDRLLPRPAQHRRYRIN